MSAAPKRFQSNVPLFIFLQLCVWATRCSTLCSYAFYELSVCLCTFVFRSVCLMARLSHVLFWPVLFSCTFVQSAPACSTSLPFAEIRSRFWQTTPSPSREVRARIAAMQNMHMGLVWSDGLLLALAHFFRPVCAGEADCVRIWAEMPTTSTSTATWSGLGGVPARPGQQPWSGGSA